MTYPTHLHQGTRRVGPSLHGQSRCRRRSMSCKLHGTRARGMMRRTTIEERGVRATGSKKTWGVGTKSGPELSGPEPSARNVSAAATDRQPEPSGPEPSARTVSPHRQPDRRTRRGPNRQRGSSRGKAAGGRGRGICVARRYAGPPNSLRKWRQFRRSQPPIDGEA